MMFDIDEKPDILINYTKGKPDLQYWNLNPVTDESEWFQVPFIILYLLDI